ncbi:hypothetical protein FRC01_010861 [Tulasnella sp. 417]|nr:hypothetical protein FRC01_010861 [Tulasnella sp. 417]
MRQFGKSSVEHRTAPVAPVPYPSATTSGKNGRPSHYVEDATNQEAVQNQTRSNSLINFVEQFLDMAFGAVRSSAEALTRRREWREATIGHALKDEMVGRSPRSVVPHTVQTVVVVPRRPEYMLAIQGQPLDGSA